MSIARVLLPLVSLVLFGCMAPSSAKVPVDEVDVTGRTTSSWAARLNPTGQVPSEGFKAVCFDRKNLDRGPITQNVDSIAIKYAWDDFHQIDSPNFAGYWVGQLNMHEAAGKQITVSQSWAKTRILIDGEVVFEGGNNTSFTHAFTRGRHVIEVEYINNWHTTEFKVTIGDETKESSLRDVSSQLRAGAARDSRLHYIGIYESGAADTRVNVAVPRTGRPIVLWLASYEAVDWNISASDPVEGVVMSSYAPGSRLFGVQPGQVFRTREGPRQHSEGKRCSCGGGGTFHCEDRGDLLALSAELEQLTGLPLAGYAMRYAATDLTSARFNEDARQRVLAIRQRNDETQRTCAAHSNPDFDDIFDD